MDTQSRQCSTLTMISYSTGEITNSLMMNTIFGFAMLFYTDALGLSSWLASIAMFAATGWDAVSDPIMGHITDNTKSRFGRRHPYILIGGILVSICFYFLWHIPAAFNNSTMMLFAYLIVMNILLRTGITVFSIPFIALGFEICSDYSGRVRLQGIRNAVNMLANFLGPGLAWVLFFSNNEVKRATHVEANYLYMSNWFTAVSMVAVFILVFVTSKYAKDSRSMITEGNDLKGFKRDMKEIISDPYPRFVFAFMTIAILGIVLVSTLQMYLYEHFMKFAGWEKTIAHGGSMVASAVGGLTASRLTRWWDKKRTVFVSVIVSVMSNFFIAAVFLTGFLKSGQTLELGHLSLPVAFVTFVIPHMLYWAGNGMIFPIATSMIADVSELYELKTGINKDGAYAAVFSFAQKCAMSIGFLFSGLCLEVIGFKEGADAVQTPPVIWRICAVALIVGPIISLTALGLINFYPVTKELLYRMRSEKLNSAISQYQ